MNEGLWTFGEAPLTETCALAELLRAVAGHALALEEPTDTLHEVIAFLTDAEARLRAEAPIDLRPRIAHRTEPERRVYLDHSRAVASYNPAFPVYTLACADDAGEGEVTFPILYEGPPGTVHGGVIAQLLDTVLQQLNCDLGVAGRTTAIEVRYRRPVPLDRTIRIVAARTVDGTRIRSTAELHLDGRLLCDAVMTSEAGRRDDLPAVSPRRSR